MASTRAHDILKDMRQRREQLALSNPSFRSLNSHDRSTPLTNADVEHSNEYSVCSSVRAKEILVNMKQKRASLSAVLEACKSPGSPRRKFDLSIGLSSAPTADSTRSWLSSIADEDDRSQSSYKSVQDSSVEIIIDTEESEIVLAPYFATDAPNCLYTIEKRSHVTIDSAKSGKSSWTFRTQSSARNLYQEESSKVSHLEGKHRRNDHTKGGSSGKSFSSSLRMDVQQLKNQRSSLRGILDSISEMKEMGNFSTTTSSPRCPTNNIRPRHDDSSIGSAPLVMRPPRPTLSRRDSFSSSRSAPLERISCSSFGRLTPTSLGDSKDSSDKIPNTSIPSHYMIDTSKSKCRSKKIVRQTCGSSSHERKSSKVQQDDGVQMISSIEIKKRKPDRSKSHRKIDGRQKKERFQEEGESLCSKSTSILPGSDGLASHSNELLKLPESYRSSKSRKDLQQTKEVRFSDASFILYHDTEMERESSCNDTLSGKGKVDAKVETLGRTELKSGDDCSVKLTRDEIVEEMNRLAAKLRDNKCSIPIGTELVLRRRNPEMKCEDEKSSSGWSFMEASDLSSCSIGGNSPISKRFDNA